MPITPEQARINGRKGGRKKGEKTLAAERARAFIANEIVKYMPIIFDSLMNEVKKGNVQAAKELLDRGFGRAPQALDITTKGEKLENSQEVKELSNKFDAFFKEANK